MKRLVLATIATSFALTACQMVPAKVNYSDFKQMPLKTESLNGEMVGDVSGEEGGAIWNDCTEKAKGSVEAMIDNAKAKGANAIGDIKWAANNTDKPTCKKGWGYFALWPFILTPLFMSTKVTGKAYKTSGAKHGLLMLPQTPEEKVAFINKIVGN